MIPKDKALKLIKIYIYVCSQYQETLNCYCQRYSNNSKPQFSDEDSLIVDSMPIMTCCGRNRQSKVGREIADKRVLFNKEPVLSRPQVAPCRLQEERASAVPVPDCLVFCIRERPDRVQTGVCPCNCRQDHL